MTAEEIVDKIKEEENKYLYSIRYNLDVSVNDYFLIFSHIDAFVTILLSGIEQAQRERLEEQLNELV